MDARATIYSQYFRGIWNVIADSLSRDFRILDADLTTLLKILFPSQVPKNFASVHYRPQLSIDKLAVARYSRAIARTSGTAAKLNCL